MSRARAQELSDKERARQAHILMSVYSRLYKQHHGDKPRMNRYSAKWGMMDVIDSIGVQRAEELIEFYFSTTHRGHDIEFFYKNFDKMDHNEKTIRQDRLRRAKIMAETRRRVEEGQNQQ